MAISLVGTATNTGLDGSNVSLTLPVGTTTGDVVYVAYTTAATSDQNLSMVTSGYTELADLYSNDTEDTNLGAYRKVQGGSPDSTAQVTGGGGLNDGVAALCYVLRGVDTTTPEDATTTTATGTDSGRPDGASITTVTNGAWVLVLGGSSDDANTAIAPSGYTNLVAAPNGSDTNDTHVVGATKEVVTAGAENPAVFTGLASFNTSYSWAAATVAVRPGPTTISGTASITEAADTVSGTSTVALKGTASITEAADALSSAATILIKGAASPTEAGDTLSSTATLLIKGTLSATEAGDALTATGVLPIAGTLSVTEADDTLSADGVGQPITTGTLNLTEADDRLTATAALAIVGTVTITEAADTLTAAATIADAPPAGVFIRHGGIDERPELWRQERERKDDLRRIIDQAFAIANGEIDPVTLEPIPLPDFEGLALALRGAQEARDQADMETLLAAEVRRQEEEAIAVLLLAA